MAEIDLETKLSHSHRGRALAALLPLIEGEERGSVKAKQ
jgi:inosine/xanthosine triphosphate pyrophosphatase family protein